jgi:hypothetical protein
MANANNGLAYSPLGGGAYINWWDNPYDENGLRRSGLASIGSYDEWWKNPYTSTGLRKPGLGSIDPYVEWWKGGGPPAQTPTPTPVVQPPVQNPTPTPTPVVQPPSPDVRTILRNDTMPVITPSPVVPTPVQPPAQTPNNIGQLHTMENMPGYGALFPWEVPAQTSGLSTQSNQFSQFTPFSQNSQSTTNTFGGAFNNPFAGLNNPFA